MKPEVRILALTTFVVAATPLGGQMQGIPETRTLGAVVARAALTFPAPPQVVALSDGRVVVNDVRGRRLLLLDSMLANPVGILDTESGPERMYGVRGGEALRYSGDTILFVDTETGSILVIDPAGRIARVVAPVPGMPLSGLRVDGDGRLLFERGSRSSFGSPGAIDSTPIVRVSLSAREADTVGYVRWDKLSQSERSTRQDANGNPYPPTRLVLPVRHQDLWTTISDGTIAIAHAHNFTVDWIDAAGQTSTPRIPYEWKRLSDGEKAAIVDSIRARRSESPLMVRLSTGETVPSPERVLGIEAVPDFLPPFGGGGHSESDAHVLGDGDGRLWVRVAVNTSVVPRARGEPPPAAIYSVISRAEGLVDRIRVPEGAAIVGFGRGVAYVATHDAGAVKLERVRIRQ